MTAVGSRKRAAWAALLSILVPGLGQIYAGLWRFGVALYGLSVVVSLSAIYVTTLLPPAPAGIGTVFVLILLALCIQLFASVSAWLSVRRRSVRPRPRWFRSAWFAAIGSVIIGTALAQIVHPRWRSFSTPSTSMSPTLIPGDYFFAREFPSGDGLRRGDVVVFPSPRNPSIIYVKRVVGLPGDRMAVRGGMLVINGVTVPVEPDGTQIIDSGGQSVAADRFVERLPDGASHLILVQTSQRTVADTSEQVVAPGTVFVMGDNRDNSLDSRFPAQFGVLSAANVTQRAETIFWSGDSTRILTPVQ